MKPPSDIVVGQYLQLICLCIAAAIAAVYTAGYVAGTQVHRMNEFVTEVFVSCLFSFRQIKALS
jgi:hypothetical protein